MGRKNPSSRAPTERPVAANSSQIDRRAFLARSAGVAGAAAAGLTVKAAPAAEDAPSGVPPWMQTMGTPMRSYGNPSKFEGKVLRVAASGYAKVTPGAGASRTPLQALEGTITPSGLHFERHHNGVPEIDPAQHRLLIHGLVRKPLIFTMETLERYPMTSRVYFVECAGNSGPNTVNPQPPQATAQACNAPSSGVLKSAASCQ